MYIVGTSGHIDHGKTSIIKALTGIDCDRLPEEKKREMTIDIGFASIEYPRFGTVSIIDVPGHERFIRNMVVGAWGVDLALLIIAVDDGWMPQTEDHFRVLQLLGIERIITVANKIDLADDEMIEFVEEEIKEKLADTVYAGSDIVKVSAKTGDGIDELRETIVANLRQLSKASNVKKPYLFIDRIFGSKGYGTVITGTQKNGIFNEDETVHVLPLKKDGRIKRIESHFNVMSEGNPSQRTAMNISGVSIDELKRGDIIYKENFFTESNDIIARIQILNKKKKMRNNLGIEVLIGTSAIKGKIIHITDENSNDVFPVRIKFKKPWFFYPGQPFVIASPGGYRIIGGGKVLFPEYDNRKYKNIVKSNLKLLNSYSKDEIIEYIVSVYRWITKNKILSMFPDSQKNIEKVINALEEKGSVRIIKDYIIINEYYDLSVESMVEVINKNVGLNLKEISDFIKADLEICKVIAPYIVQNFPVIEKDGRFFSGDSITEDTLSDSKKKVLKEVGENREKGIEIGKMNNDRMKKEIKDLIKLGFLVSLDGNIIYHVDTYTDFKDKIMNLFEVNDKLTVPEAKDAIGLSRKYAIPLLNRIETDGLIKRLGDFRIKV